MRGGFEKGAGGLVKSGALMGIFSAATTKAIDLVSASVDGAISRFDTLNNYPRVMQALGYSAEESEGSIAKVGTHLTGLPTALNDMMSTIQGITAVTGDLTLATDAGLALNDMLLASGSSTELTTAAMEQFRQMLSNGKPELEEWKTLNGAMPGQMKQLAEAMLGPTANAGDLYAALGGGKNEAVFSMDELMRKMIELDTASSEGFTSFAEQAKNATGGVESSMSNMQTAVSRGMAGVLESVGTDTISSALSGLGGAFENALGMAGDAIAFAKPHIAGLIETAKDIAPSVIPAAAGLVSLAAAGKGLGGLASVVSGTTGAFGGIKGVAKGASDSLLTLAASMKGGSKASEGLLGMAGALGGAMGGPLVVGIGAAVGFVGLLVGSYLDAEKKSKTFEVATKGLSDAVSRTTALDDYAGKVDGVGGSAETTAMSVDELAESMAASVEKMNETAKAAEGEIAQLNTAQGIIGQYAGATDLSAEAQGRLEWALKLVNEQFGLSLTAADVAADAYKDADGNTVDLKDSIYELIEAKKQEIKLAALSEQITEAYAAQSEASATLAADQKKLRETKEGYVAAQVASGEASREEAERVFDENVGYSILRDNVDKASEAYYNATDNVALLNEELGDSAKATSEAADEFDRWASTTSLLFQDTLKANSTTLAGLKDDLRGLGASTEELGALSEEQLLLIATAYDGTAGSVAGILSELGFDLDETALKSAISADGIRQAITDMGDGVTSSLDGVNLRDFSKRLADAEISAEQLNAIGSMNLAELAANCNGDIELMVSLIKGYNQTPVIDKDGNITVEDGQLMLSQGRLWTWNGTGFVDKEGRAAVQDQELIDAQGRVWAWDLGGGRLTDKYGNASVSGNIDWANREVAAFRDQNADLGTKTGTVNIYRNTIESITRTVSNAFNNTLLRAAGGIRPNAEGGYRLHASGAIVHKAVPLDIVGEDGAEAIVPLTNKQYSLPFARTLAEQMGGIGTAATKADIYDAMYAALESSGALRPVIILDGRELSNGLAPYIGTRLGQIEKRRSVGL